MIRECEREEDEDKRVKEDGEEEDDEDGENRWKSTKEEGHDAREKMIKRKRGGWP